MLISWLRKSYSTGNKEGEQIQDDLICRISDWEYMNAFQLVLTITNPLGKHLQTTSCMRLNDY